MPGLVSCVLGSPRRGILTLKAVAQPATRQNVDIPVEALTLKRLLIITLSLLLLAAPLGCFGLRWPSRKGNRPPPSGDNQPPPEPTIYDIRGRSSTLTDAQWQAMLAWRADAAKMVHDLPGVYINGQPDRKAVCLTFDDAPDAIITPQVLTILAEAHVKANFFVVGKWIEDDALVKRAYQEGHLILNHTWGHRSLTKLTDAEVAQEVKQSEDKLFAITGKRPAMVRPPFGDLNAAVAKVLHDGGNTIVLWSLDTLDWSVKDAADIVSNVTDNVRPGEIILMHSTLDRDKTVTALPAIISYLKEKGYAFIGLDEMLGVSAYR